MASGEKYFKPNSIIFFEGDAPGPLYLIKEGIVNLTKKDLSVDINLTNGDILGVPSSVSNMPRLYTARVIEEIFAIEIPAENFKTFIRGNIPAALKIVQKLCAELRKINQIVSEPVKAGSEKGMLDIGDYYYNNNQLLQSIYIYETYLETYSDADDYEDIGFKLAGIYEKNGDKSRACQIYKNLRDKFAPHSMKWEAYHKLAKSIDPFASEMESNKDASSLLAEAFGSIGGDTSNSAKTETETEDKENIIGFLMEEQEKSDNK